jgi:hypothetical protein
MDSLLCVEQTFDLVLV